MDTQGNLDLQSILHQEIFRAYDIRGIVDISLTKPIMQAIGFALGQKVLALGEEKIVVARDGRLSGPELNLALKSGILASGLEVIDVGCIPTPLLYFAAQKLKSPSAVMITGSHNPREFNGLKMMMGGKILFGDAIQELYHQILQNQKKEETHFLEQQDLLITKILIQNSANDVDHSHHLFILDNYQNEIQQNIQLQRPLKVVIDCGNGVTGELAPKIFQNLGCEVIPLFCDIDGHFPNHHPDPGKPENLMDLRSAILQHQADIGLAFDGDGDRLGVLDNEGNIIWPDRLLILFAKHVLQQHPKAKILYDVKCSQQVEQQIKKMNGIPMMWKTGHSFIKAKMQEESALLAGELSGHLFFKDRWYGFDDAIYAGARMLEILSQTKESSGALFKGIPDTVNTPEITIPVLEKEKTKLIADLIDLIHAADFSDAVLSTIDGLRVDFLDGFGLIRASNTGPQLVLRFEGTTREALNKIQEKFRKLLSKVDAKLKIPF